MKSIKIIFLCCLPLMAMACKGKTTDTTSGLKILSGYFFKNTHSINETSYFVFSGKESFDDYLGVARTMNNKVDEPDFATNMVAAIACPPTNNNTEIIVTKIEKSGDAANVYFEIKTGDAISFSMQPVAVFSFTKSDDIRAVNFVTNDVPVKTITLDRRAAGAPKSPADLTENYMGVFSGILPCADCPGIETTLTLNPDYTYTLKMVYQDRNNVEPLMEQGKWTPSEDLAFIELNYDKEEGGTYYAFIDKNTLEKLDNQAQPIQSNLNHKLVRQ